MKSHSIQTNFLSLVMLTGFVACSSQPAVQELSLSANPTDEIASLDKDLKSAKETQLDAFSPNNFREANKSLSQAKAEFLQGRDSKKVLHDVAVGRAYLDNAKVAAKNANENIEDVVVARKDAMDAGAQNYFYKEFADADSHLVDVTKDIEKNNMSSAMKKRADLQARFLNLEMKAIKEKNLKESRDMIELARKESAEKYAPRTLAAAQKSYLDTEAFIKANPHQTTEIETR